MIDQTLGTGAACLAGAMAGVGIAGIASSFTWNGGLLPWPRCGSCGVPHGLTASLPVLGSALQRSCSACRVAQPWLPALLVQLLAAVLFGLLFRQLGFTARWLVYAVETVVLLAVAMIDFQHRLIPTLLVYPAVIFAIATSAAWPGLGVVNSLIGGALAFALFFALALLARVTFGEGALGAGDVTLAALIGAICGYPLLVLALALGALFGGIGALVALAIRRSTIGSTIPYGPFLVAGVLYVMVNGYALHPLFTVP